MKRVPKIPSRLLSNKEPVWKGPEVDGITQSLISRFLVCRERFRVLVIEGLAVEDSFNIPLEYGQMWHTCEEALANETDWLEALRLYCSNRCKQLPQDKERIERWYHICKIQFPIYVAYWESHKDTRNRTPVFQEEVFKIKYKLPSGRVVLLRGKFDSVDVIGSGRRSGVYLQENKAKGRIDEEFLSRQLTFDLQTMVYLIALIEGNRQGSLSSPLTSKVKGVRYNVVRRPLAGGEGSIVQRKGRIVNAKSKSGKVLKDKSGNPLKERKGVESDKEFFDRLEGVITDRQDFFFKRWKVEITPADIQNFKDKFLDPCLEHICQWYELQTVGHVTTASTTPLHYRLPYGVYNSLLEGRGSDLEEYLLSGSQVGLRKIDQLFPELE